MEEQLRLARVNRDAATLSQLLDTAFTGTDSAGATLNRTRALQAFQASAAQSIVMQLTSGSMLDKTAFTMGTQTEITTTAPGRFEYTVVQFTRVWTNTASGWKLLQSVEFRPQAGTATSFAAAPVVPPGTVVRVGGNIKEPTLLTPNIKPTYPQVAKDASIQGLVIVEAVIDEEGRVTNARVIKPVHGLLDQAALEAVRRWTYTPTLLNGAPVSVLLNVAVNFALQ
jgi:protein TonB